MNDTAFASGSTVVLDAFKLAAARLRAAEHQPFLAVALYALVPIARPELGTFAIDERWRLYVDPDVLASWSVEEVSGVLLHEVGHLVREHAERGRDLGVDVTTKERWNVAGDIEINDALLRDGAVLPGQACTSRLLRLPPGRAAEFYYRALDKRDLPPVRCGAGAHGVPGAEDDSRTDGGLGVSAIEAELLRQHVAQMIVAAEVARPGSVAGTWVRWAQARLDPQIDWRQLLRSAIRRSVAMTAGATDFTYQRPSRRRVPNVVMAAMAKPVPSVAIVIDTSGSIVDDSLSVAFSEAHHCLRQLGVRRDLLTVWATDTEAHRVNLGNARRLSVMGGGGTDMRVGISAALRTRPSPGMIVVLTDGHTPWPAHPPPCRVVVALLPSEIDPEPVPSWADLVRVHPD